ncbi:choice-of-anchor Q domain-containing protein [Chloroflexota bacterium]
MKANIKIWFVVVFILVFSAGWIILSPYTARADGPWYVQTDGDDGNTCLSPGPSNACATIQAAVDKASPGDMIYVAVGIYTGTGENVVFIGKADLYLSGGWDSTFTSQEGYSIIDGQSTRRCIRIGEWGGGGTGTTNIDHFLIQNGNNSGVAGIYNYNGDVRIENCIIENNIGTGVYNSALMSLNIVSIRANVDNDLSGGGGIFNGGTLIVNNSSIVGNESAGNGGGIRNDNSLVVNNSTISENLASYGGGVYNYYGTITISSSTIHGNTSINQGGGIRSSNNLSIKNSILAGNTGDSSPDCLGNIDSQGYNLIGDSAGCTFNSSSGDIIGGDPLLGQLIGIPGYHHLFSGSPAIDAGNPTGCTDDQGILLNTDQRGASRVGRCDIGSYEYSVPGTAAKISVHSGSPQNASPLQVFDLPLQAVVMDDIGSPVENITVTFSAPTIGASGTFENSESQIVKITNDSGIANGGLFTANGIAGPYTVTAQIESLGLPAIFDLTNIVWYVKTDGDNNNSCQTPISPCGTVGGVFEKSGFVDGDSVLLGGGIYTSDEGQVILLDRSARLIGGWNATFTEQSGVTSIDGEGLRRGIAMYTNQSVILDNMVILNGFTDSSGGGILNNGTLTINNSKIISNSAGNYGGGISGSATLNDCMVANNSAHWGGGVAVTNIDSAVVNRSTISDNDASFGGGIYVEGNVYLTNSTITNNTANNGGGVYTSNSEEIIIRNSTVYNNIADYGGGFGISSDDEIELHNSILSNNIATEYYPDCVGNVNSEGFNLIGDISGCSYTPGVGDMIGLDPKLDILRDNGGPTWTYALLPRSPAINAIPVGDCDVTEDQRGVERPLGLGCEIGAYEVHLALEKMVNDSNPDPGETITFTMLAGNYHSDTVTGAIISETMPAGLNFIGPVTLDPPESGMGGLADPFLVTDMEIIAGQIVTVTFPVSISYGLPGDTQILNTAIISSNAVVYPVVESENITVAHVPPVAVNDTGDKFTTFDLIPFTTGNVLENDYDDNGDLLTVIAIDTTGTLGSVMDNGDGTFFYDPNGQYDYLLPGEQAIDIFTYTVSDGFGGEDTATVTIVIIGGNYIYLPIIIG